jgi:hypothetical protein
MAVGFRSPLPIRRRLLAVRQIPFTFNRTSMESFNRTSMELKQKEYPDIRHPLHELLRYSLSGYKTSLLIEPVWN